MATIYETIQDLASIITNAITDGTEENVPARSIRNTLIRVSTGRYKEVLPIIVPEECCVIGDELRSTNVQPRTIYNDNTLTPKSDFIYSSQALQRIEDVVGDIVSGQAVTPTTGNTITQDQSWPYAESGLVAPQVQKAFRGINKQIDSKLGDKVLGTLPRAYELVDPDLGHARDLIFQNKKFIQDEIIAYIADGYPGLAYSRTKCRQDVGFIIDALAYDLSYGGNWQSINAGLAYYSGREGDLQIASSEKAATLDAYGRLKELLRTIGRNVTVAPVFQTDTAQVFGIGGDAAIVTPINDNMDTIIDIINNGPSSAPAITYPSTSAVEPSLIAAADTLDSNKAFIQESTIDFINENFGSFAYKSSKCRRDLNNIITDTAFDVALGTNYNALFNGIAYQRPNNNYNLNNQRVETIGAIRFARDQVITSVTDDGSSEVGSSTASARVRTAYNEIVDIIQNGSLGTAMPGDGVVNALSLPSPVGVDQNRVDAKDNLQANIEFMKADVLAFIANNYPSLTYSSDKCARDVEYIVNAQSYDVLYGGTMATSRIAESYFMDGEIQVDGQTTETAAAYDHLASIMSQIVQESAVTAQSGNTELQTTLGTPASATEAAEIQANVELISDVIGGTTSLSAVLAATTYPDITWAAADIEAAYSSIESDKNDIIRATIQYIGDTYNNFTYNHAKCSRDLGLIIDAAKYDWMLGTNYASIVAALSYLRGPSEKVTGNQKTATIAGNEYARTLAIQYVNSNATAIAGINNTWEWVDDTIHYGSGDGSNDAVEDQEVWNAIRMLDLNKEFIVQEAMAHVDEYFKDTVIETVSLDSTLANFLVISDTSWLVPYMPVKFTDFDDSVSATENSGLDNTTTYYVRDIYDDTKFSVSLTVGGPAVFLNDEQEGNFIVSSAYSYSTTACARDVREYVNAVMHDLEWPSEWKRKYTRGITIYRPGAYETRLAARYYANAVLGSQEEDFYYMRNGCGLRNQTLDGLRGDLSAQNEFGTQRPTAGAYASLDPGFGPNDQRAWITARSPYLQNNTCFGYAATGQKIDGALHNGGNDSIVSNDFTQVISDGIGAWITNNGRAELVSVFTYYAHIGYLSEAGGRIRGTNGNNSYGKFGSVAEGVDPDEIPVTAIVDNRTQYNATISNILTNANQILQLEFDHAGNEYTEAVIDIFGPGENEALLADEFRDGAVAQCRVVETVGGVGTAGGSSYTVVSNTAQGGSTTTVDISQTDGALSTAYVGMKVYIVGGAATGQYGIIDTYDAGTKTASVVKESDGTAGWDHVVAGTTIVAPNSTSTYQIEPRIHFTAPPSSETTHTGQSGDYTAVHYAETSAQYTGLAGTSDSDGAGVTFDVTRNGSKYYVDLNTAGTGYVRLDTITLPGTSLGGTTPANDIVITLTTIDANTGSVIDFDFTGLGRKGLFLATPNSDAGGQYSYDGETWVAGTLPSVGGGNVYGNITSGLLDDGTSVFKESRIIAVSEGGGAVYSSDGLTWTAATLPGTFSTAGATDIAFGQVASSISRFVAISANDTDVIYTDDGGANWVSLPNALPSVGYNTMAYGAGRFVALRSGTNDIVYSNDGVIWSSGTGLPNADWSDVSWGNGRFVAITSTGTTGAYSLDGLTWVSMTITTGGSGLPKRIAYGQGVFVVTTTDATTISRSENGLYWNTSTVTSATGGYNAVAFGNPAQVGRFVALASGTSTQVLEAKEGATAKARVSVASEQIFAARITEPGSGYVTAPTFTVTDPGNINDVEFDVRLGNGSIAQPSWNNRGTGFVSASADINAQASNGFADFFQDGAFVAVRRLSSRPVNGSNIEFASLPGRFFKLVNTVSFLGQNDGSYTAFLQVSPTLEIAEAPTDGDEVELRIRFSQVRLTGHDFLDIGTGNFEDTNYPNTPVNNPDPDKETEDFDGGRVFYTATDQDGNFRVGGLFSVEQATGVATLDAEAFNIAGLQELSLGEVTLGGNSASITEFSTDPFFTANSDTIVPTQRAIKAYIEAQIGGGGASLNVNSVTAGDIFIGTNEITTVTGQPINIKANVNFAGTVLGLPLAYNYFLR